ncbi:MAG: DUF5110 domain-containing protein, partial [Clostridia bacterium]|nr:DUF5110 domain-containing protein [Clostridia bacterium]
GPVTVSVSHGTDTSPIFVKKGGVLALADNMPSTGDGDWSHLTLDVYPGADGAATVYEDDCETVAYKDGQFRETRIVFEDEGGLGTLTVFPAEGSFTGERAFTRRNYTVRVHSDMVASAALNGEALELERIDRDESGKPFAVTGDSPDGAVYEFCFSAGVGEKSVVSLRLG